MSKVLITGNKGFIGSHLAKKLEELGHEVVGYDLKEGKDIRTITPKDLEGIDYVFHMAAQAKVPLSIDQPLMTHDHNVNGTLNVLECARQAKVKRVIYSASSSAYGIQDILPLYETMTPNPMSPYGVQKLVGEYYCKVYSEVYGLETVSLRYFNVYGEDMPTDNAYSACIAIFLQNSRQGKPLTVYGGKQTRDFTYVGDVVDANIKAMESENVGHGEVINIGGGENHSVNTIAETIGGTMVYEPQRKGEPMNTLSDCSKAKELLGWEAKTKLIEWLKSQ
jgi:UDP-glucose 4-epimerase